MIFLRNSTDDDLPAIHAIYTVEVLEGSASFETVPPAEEDLRLRQREILACGLPYLVAVADDRVAGYAYAGPYRTRYAYRFCVENSVYVAAWARRRGIGLLLLQELIERTRAGQWKQMIAIIGDSANVQSIELHRRAGFRHAGVLRDVGFKHNRWLDTVLMQLEL